MEFLESLPWDWILSIAGALGMWLVGKKRWWSWYVGIGTQGLWIMYALISQQYGFLASVALFGSVYVQNAYKWTKEHRAQKEHSTPRDRPHTSQVGTD